MKDQTNKTTQSSRLPGFRRLAPEERRARLAMVRDIPANYLETYSPGGGLPVDLAALMIENVVGVMALPVGVGVNLLVNGRDYLVPMVIEEPSVVAAFSAMARLSRGVGGVEAEAGPSEMIGQIQVLNCADPEAGVRRVVEAGPELVREANEWVPRLVRRGGGVRDLEARVVEYRDDSSVDRMLVVHVVVDTRDAMGANIVNTLMERLAPRVAALVGGVPGLRVLSNLADRRLVRARVVLPAAAFDRGGRAGEAVVSGIVAADRFAMADPYRAATHNKGIMNGIDAVAVATGNDWRAIEAGAHAYAARTGRYQPLTRWRRTAAGELEGRIELPMAVGIVGGAIQVHPTVKTNLHVLGVTSAGELAEVMAAVGLLQNLAALRALAAEGIQHGHMAMHARSVAVAAGVPHGWVPEVVEQMVSSGTIDAEGARRAYAALRARGPEEPERTVLGRGRASGKVILLGEHAVVHGIPALAGALDRGVEVVCVNRAGPAWVEAPDLPMAGPLFREGRDPVRAALRRVFELLEAPREGIGVTIRADLPPGKGLGSSAALAVASLRAVAGAVDRDLDDEILLEMAAEVERIFHGTPSGIDHTVAARGGVILYRRGDPPLLNLVSCRTPVPLVLLDSGEVGPTSVLVGRVLSMLEARPRQVRALFDEIGQLVETGVRALQGGDLASLGQVMNRNHSLLQSLGVSTPRLDTLVEFAREEGAVGAKLTGAGGGGMVVAVCPDGGAGLVSAAAERGITAYSAMLPAGEGTE